MEKKECWFIGECMVELRRAGPGLLAQAFAGDVYNTAVYFHRMRTQYPAHFISAVSAGLLSDNLLQEARLQGIQEQYILRVEGREPGLYWIETVDGERSFFYWRDQSAARLMLDEDHTHSLQQRTHVCRLLYFSGITLAILDDTRRERLLDLARRVREQGGWVAFDSNFRPRLWDTHGNACTWVQKALPAVSHALVTFEDEAALYGDTTINQVFQRITAAGPQEIVIKLGADGSMVQTRAMTQPLSIPTEKVKPVDTTAAGDSFNGAYLAARLNGADAADAARTASRLAARVVSHAGAIIPAAAMEDVQ